LLWLVLAVAVLVLGMWRSRTAALCGDELAGLTITGFCSALLSPVTWTHHLGWFVPALVLLAEVIAAPGPVGRRARITAAAVICYLTVTYSVVLACQAGHFSGSIGQVLAQNWDMWLALAFVEFLPIRGRPTAGDPTTTPGQTGSRALSHAMSAP
jgi:alpha-1,2-mannosyltransferase